jgi:hypothetical protein
MLGLSLGWPSRLSCARRGEELGCKWFHGLFLNNAKLSVTATVPGHHPQCGRSCYFRKPDQFTRSLYSSLITCFQPSQDRGDGNPVKPGDDQPIGLAPGMEKYLTREDVYSPLKRGTAAPGQDVERAVLSMTAEPSAKDTRPPAPQRKGSGAMIESRM